MIIWTLLGVLAVAGLCYGSYYLGKTRGSNSRPGRLQRRSIPKFVDSLIREGVLPRPPSRPVTPKVIHHEPIQGKPVTIKTKVSQGVTFGYYRSTMDPGAEIVEVLHYDGTHHDKDIPADTYQILFTEPGPTFFSAEVFNRIYAPAEVGVEIPPEAISQGHPKFPMAVKVTPPKETPAEPLGDLSQELFENMAVEYEFPTQPRTYSGPCEHSLAREQLEKDRNSYQGFGHFIPCHECGQQFEFRDQRANAPAPRTSSRN